MHLVRGREKSLLVVGALAVAVFLFHTFVAFNYGNPHLNNNEVNIIIKPLKGYLQGNPLAPWQYEANYYTGTPFFLLPLFLLLGMSPGTLQLTLAIILGMTSALSFLGYVYIAGIRRGVIAVLLLLSMSTYLIFNVADYTYQTLFTSVGLLFLAAWEHTGEHRVLYVLSLLSGLLFYFKAVMVYVLLSLGGGVVLDRGGAVIQEIGIRRFLLLAALFLLGAFPYWWHGMHTDFPLVQDVIGSGAANQQWEKPPLPERITGRVQQLSFFIHPRKALGRPGCYSCLQISSLLLLLPIGILISLLYGVYRRYTVAFILFFLLLLKVPHSVKLQQMLVLMPLVPLTILPILHLTTLKPIRTYQRSIERGIIVILLVGLALSLVQLPAQADQVWSDNARHYGGSQAAYEGYTRIGVSGVAATNSYRVWILMNYDLDVEREYLLAPPGNAIVETYPSLLTHRRYNWESAVTSPDKLRTRPLTVVWQDGECLNGSQWCWYTNQSLQSQFGPPAKSRTADIDGNQFTVARYTSR